MVQGVFTPRAIARLEPMIQSLVDDALDVVDPQGAMDVIADLAYPVPFRVISNMLGMPDTDAAQLRRWTHTVVLGLEPNPTDDQIRAVAIAARELEAHLDDVIAWKRRNLGDDLLTALIQAEYDGEVLSGDELRAQVGLLFVAGHETTVNLIGNGALALLRNRDQLERWRKDSTLDAGAVEELLRYDSPVQGSARLVVRDLELDDSTIPAGHTAIALIGSANRDPTRWGGDADELDLARPESNQHLAFGGGIHHCLGAALARLEGRVALTTLIRRFPDIESINEQPEWNGRIALRGLESLPVALRAR